MGAIANVINIINFISFLWKKCYNKTAFVDIFLERDTDAVSQLNV